MSEFNGLTFEMPREDKSTYRLSTLVDYLRPQQNSKTKAQQIFNESLREMGAFIHQHVQTRLQREHVAKNHDVELEPQCLYYIPQLDANVTFHADMLVTSNDNTYLYEIKSFSALQRHKDFCLAQASAYYYVFTHKLSKNISPSFISYSITTDQHPFTPMPKDDLAKILKKGMNYAKPHNEQYYFVLNNINTNTLSRKILVRQSDLLEVYQLLRTKRYNDAEEKLKYILFE